MSIKSKGLLLLGILLVGLTACSGKGNESPEQIYTYIPTFMEIPETDTEMNMLSAFLCDDEIIFEASADEMGLRRDETFYSLPLTGDNTQAKEISFQFPSNQVTMLDITKDSEGNYYTLESDRMSGRVVNGTTVQEGYRVCKYGPDGSILDNWAITEWLLQSTENIYMGKLTLDKDGNIYVSGYQAMLLFNPQGEYRGMIMDDGIFFPTCGTDGTIYYAVFGMVSYLKHVDFDTAQSENVATGFPVGTGMCLGENSEFWVYDLDGVYRYDADKQMPTQILSWLDADVNPSRLTDMALLPDGRVLLVLSESPYFPSQAPQLISLARTEGEDLGRETITVGVLSLTDNMRECAIQFNQDHPEYHVRLKEYMSLNSYRDRAEAMRALDLELVSGKAADMIAIPYADMEKYTSKDLLVDLAPYLDASTVLSRENLPDAIEETYTFDGKLAALPIQLWLNVLIGRQSRLGDLQQWSVEDMIAFFEQNKNATVMGSISKSTMLDVCLKFNLGYFVDAREKTCRFDTEEFSRILEFSNQFTGTGEWLKIYQEEGQLLLDMQICRYPCFTACAPQYFNNEPVSYIGYPTMDGQSGIMLSTSQYAFGILATSEHKEAAWAFLEAAILAEGKRNSMRFGNESDIIYTEFPIMKDQLEELFAASMEEANNVHLGRDPQTRRVYRTALGDPPIYCFAPLKEEVDQIWELIDQARPAPKYDDTIMGIIQEEAAGYFAGDRDIQMVTDTIQNRVQLYINEK